MFVSRGIVGRLVQDCELTELLITPTTALVAAFWASAVKDRAGMGGEGDDRSIHEPSIDTTS